MKSACVIVLSVTFLGAATFNVSNVTEFQNALTTSETNGEGDTINVASGTYNVSSTLTYNSGENFPLLVNGAGMGSTILNGGDNVQILCLQSGGSIADLIVRNISFADGNVGTNGGALHVETDGAEIHISNSEFNDNYAATMAGGVNAVSNAGDITVADCTFRRNVGFYNAGGLNVGTTSGLITLANSSFQNDTVRDLIDSVSHVGGDGGGCILYAEDGHILMTGNTFTGNFSPDDGGGGFIYLLGTGVSATVDSNVFAANHAELGGGGCFVRINGSGIMEYDNNQHSGNATSIGEGGGAFLYLNEGSLFCEGNTYVSNTSASDGGGMWAWLGLGVMDVQWNIFTTNNAGNNGGGIGIGIDDGTLGFHRNIIYGNTAGNVGGGLSYATTSAGLILFHNTTYGNSAPDGGGIYFYFDQSSAAATIVNNILWHDTPNGIAMSGAISAVATYSDIENGTGEPWFGTGCIDENPLFADPGSGDFHLTWVNFPIEDSTKSPCIDTGDPARPPDPDSTIADMGVFYFDQASGVSEDRRKITADQLYFSGPNPISGTMPVNFSIARASHVTIEVYDLTGRFVVKLLDEYKNKGVYSLNLSTVNKRSGIYFCRIKTDWGLTSQKIILIK